GRAAEAEPRDDRQAGRPAARTRARPHRPADTTVLRPGTGHDPAGRGQEASSPSGPEVTTPGSAVAQRDPTQQQLYALSHDPASAAERAECARALHGAQGRNAAGSRTDPEAPAGVLAAAGS